MMPNPDGMPDWAPLSPEKKKLYARQMEVQAAMISHLDHQIGRVLEVLEARGELENTMLIITSDNGSSEGGGEHGTFHLNAGFNGVHPTVEQNMTRYEEWGGPGTMPNFALGWAVATNTPTAYWKQTTFEGGIRVPLIMAWPKGIAARGEWRSQFANISDITPTVLDALDEKPAAVVNGVPQMPFDGQSLVDTFTSNAPSSAERAQYFETGYNIALIQGDWKIVFSPVKRGRAEIEASAPKDWELYNLKSDPGEARNLAATYPDRVAQMVATFKDQAARYNVDLLGSPNAGFAESAKRLAAEIERRDGKWGYIDPIARIGEGSAPPLLLRSYIMTADVPLDRGDETGVIFSLGSNMAGFSLYLDKGKPVFALRSQLGELTKIASPTALGKGMNKLTFSFQRPSPELMKPIDIDIAIGANGKTLASQRAQFAMPFMVTSDNTFDIGRNDGGTVVPDYPAQTPFPGVIRNFVFDFKPR